MNTRNEEEMMMFQDLKMEDVESLSEELQIQLHLYLIDEGFEEDVLLSERYESLVEEYGPIGYCKGNISVEEFDYDEYSILFVEGNIRACNVTLQDVERLCVNGSIYCDVFLQQDTIVIVEKDLVATNLFVLCDTNIALQVRGALTTKRFLNTIANKKEIIFLEIHQAKIEQGYIYKNSHGNMGCVDFLNALKLKTVTILSDEDMIDMWGFLQG